MDLTLGILMAPRQLSLISPQGKFRSRQTMLGASLVAVMSHGLAVRRCKSLKQNGKVCDKCDKLSGRLNDLSH